MKSRKAIDKHIEMAHKNIGDLLHILIVLQELTPSEKVDKAISQIVEFSTTVTSIGEREFLNQLSEANEGRRDG